MAQAAGKPPTSVIILSALVAAILGLLAYAFVFQPRDSRSDANATVGVTPTPTSEATADSSTPTPERASSIPPSSAPAAPHTVLMHDGVLLVELPEEFVWDDLNGRWTNGTAHVGCWAWRDASLPGSGTTPADINNAWVAQWNEWGYYSADEIWTYDNDNGYADSDIWYIVHIYETDAGDYDFEVWEPQSYLIDGDVFVECFADVYSPTEHPGVGWDDFFRGVVESVTIVNRDALLTNVWGTERGDF